MSEEAKQKAEAVVFKFEEGAFHLRVDSDKDGEPALELKVNLGEAGSEALAKLFKKD